MSNTPNLKRFIEWAVIFFYGSGAVWLGSRIAIDWIELAKFGSQPLISINMGYLLLLGLALLIDLGLFSAAHLQRSLNTKQKLYTGVFIGTLVSTALLGGFYALVNFSRSGNLPPALWQKTSLINDQIWPDGGFRSKTCNLPLLLTGHQELSPVHLLENGQPLGPANAVQTDVANQGQGRYSFWVTCVYFAASDNSDPRINGRTYSIEVPLFLLGARNESMMTVFLLATIALAYAALGQVSELSDRLAGIGVLFKKLSVFKWIACLRDALEAVLASDRTTGYLARTVGVGLAVLVFVGISFTVLPPAIVSFLSNDTVPGLVFLGVILYIAYRADKWIGELLALVVTFALYSMQLASTWTSAHTDGDMIAGLLPWSDASGYYWGAQRLLSGQLFDTWQARRPWFAGLLAFLSELTGRNLQWTLLLLVLITAVASFLLVREIQREHGAVAAAMSQVIIFVFYQRFVGETLTEHLGLALGILALAVLWRGARERRSGLISLGIVLMGLALVARAGAFFVLPLLVVWAIWVLRHSVKGLAHFLPIGAVVLVFVLDMILRLFVSGSSTGGFANFSNVFYGVVVGNKGWTQIYTDHPEINSMDELQAANETYRLAFEAIRHDPGTALRGVLATWTDYFDLSYGVFSFIPVKGQLFSVDSLWPILGGLGIIACLVWRRKPQYSMMLAICAGILLSVPMVPPSDADTMRAYAATIPVTAFLIGLGLSAGISTLRNKSQKAPNEPMRLAAATPALSVAFAICCLLGPIVLRILIHPVQLPTQQAVSCPEGNEIQTLHFFASSSIAIVADSVQQQTKVPVVRASDFRSVLNGLSEYPELIQLLGTIKPGMSLTFATSLNDGNYYWLIGDTQILPNTATNAQVCVQPLKVNLTAINYRFYQMEALFPLR